MSPIHHQFFQGPPSQILAAEFLTAHPEAGFRPFIIQPRSDHPGYYIFVSDGFSAFDVDGLRSLQGLVADYEAAQKDEDRSWAGECHPLEMAHFIEDYGFPEGDAIFPEARLRAQEVMVHYRGELSRLPHRSV